MEEFAHNEYVGNTVSVSLMKNESLRLRFDTLNLDSDTVIIDAIQRTPGPRIKDIPSYGIPSVLPLLKSTESTATLYPSISTIISALLTSKNCFPRYACQYHINMIEY